MGITHLGVNAQNMKECMLMSYNLRLLSQDFARIVIEQAISILEICKTALHQLQLHIKMFSLSLQLSYQENTILKQTSFLENPSIIQNGH